MISESKKNITEEIEERLSKYESKFQEYSTNLEEVKIKIENLVSNYKETREKIENSKLEYTKFDNNLAIKIEENKIKYEESINKFKLFNFNVLQTFDEQFEQVFQGLGSNYIKISNLENFDFDGKRKETEIKRINNLSVDGIKEIINKN